MHHGEWLLRAGLAGNDDFLFEQRYAAALERYRVMAGNPLLREKNRIFPIFQLFVAP